MVMENWKRINRQLNVKTYVFYGNEKEGGAIWVVKSQDKDQQFEFGGVNGKGYIKNKYFADRQEALKEALTYTKSH